MQPLTPEPQGAGLGAPPFLGRPQRFFGACHNPATRWVSWSSVSCDVTCVTLCLTCGFLEVKSSSGAADTDGMNTSTTDDSRAQKGIPMVRNHRSSDTPFGVSADVLEAAISAAEGTADPREGRVERALARMGAGAADARAVAQAMIASVVADLSV